MNIKKTLLSLLLCVAMIFSLCLFSASASAFTVVTTDAVRLRSSAEISDDNYITTLGVKEELTLLSDSQNGWAKVKRSNGQEGYCSVDYLNVSSSSAVLFTGETTDDVNFRQGPSTDYTAIGFLSNGTEFSVIDNSNEYWVKAQVGELTGYIYRTYTYLTLSLNSQVPTEPETTTPTVPETEPVTTAPKVTEPETQPQTTDPVEDIEVIDPKTPHWYADSLLESDSLSSRSPFADKFTLNTDKVDLKTGQTFDLNTLSANGGLDNLVTFTTSDKAVATVYKNGVVMGISEGKAVITATLRDRKVSCEVNVTGKPVVPTEPETTAPTEPATTIPTEPVTTVPVTTEPPTTAPLTFELSHSKAQVEAGNIFVLTAPVKNPKWSSSNKNVLTVDSNGWVTALKEGKALVTATADGRTGTCEITVTKASTGLEMEYTEVEVSKGKTFFNSADSSASITWTSSDKKIATVSNGFITGTGTGKAVITATSSKGTKTCLVTVNEAEPVRFAYAYPNTAAKNEDITLVAITDKTPTAVQFKVNINGTTKTIDATNKKADGNTLVWTGTVAISESGTFNVTAYAKRGTMFASCKDSKTTVFVRENSDLMKETKEFRRASDELITLLSLFEGYVGNVYFDQLAGGLPTLGYGKVVYTGDTFYNDMTKTEAYAMLCDTVNNGGYSSNVNTYLESFDANYNQQQFDALVSFAYNIGYYGLRSDSEIRALILESKEKKPATNVDKNAAYVNSTQVNFRKGAGTEFESLGWLSYPDTLTLIDTKLVNTNWYYVKDAEGRVGYIHKNYVTLGAPMVEGEIYLSLIDKAEFTRVVLEYHHASSACIHGLLYRRVDELDLFYYGDYERDGDENFYGYSFECYKDKSFKL